jgi:hypothetical protein
MWIGYRGRGRTSVGGVRVRCSALELPGTVPSRTSSRSYRLRSLRPCMARSDVSRIDISLSCRGSASSVLLSTFPGGIGHREPGTSPTRSHSLLAGQTSSRWTTSPRRLLRVCHARPILFSQNWHGRLELNEVRWVQGPAALLSATPATLLFRVSSHWRRPKDSNPARQDLESRLRPARPA